MTDSKVDVRGLVTVPAVIAAVVTLARLVGELLGGAPGLFSTAPGGGFALVGIVWLVPIFGAHFAVKLVRSGHRPRGAGRVVALSIGALVAAMALMAGVVALTGDPNVSVSFAGAVAQQIGFAVAALVSVLIVRKAWPSFFRTMLAYAFASRLPVLVVMLVAMLASWGTHYEFGPPGYPEMGFLPKFVLIAVFPQLTFWVAFTVVIGALFGGLAAAVAARTEASEARAA
jgi:hypothetical protein